MKYLKMNTGKIAVDSLFVKAPSRPVTAMKPAIYCYIIHCLISFGTVLYAGESLTISPGGFINPYLSSGLPLIEKFTRWDAHWYTYVAQHGYDPQSIVFFPVLILTIRAIAPILAFDYALTGLLICNLCAAISFALFYKLCRLNFTKDVSLRALIAYAVFPTSFYLNSIYTEAVFFAFALSCIYFTRIGKWGPAALFAFISTLARNIGIFLVVFMAFEYYRQYQRNNLQIKTGIVYLAAAPLALCIFMAYNYWLTGDFIAFIHAQKSWGREFYLPWVNIWSCIVQIYQTLPSPEPSLLLDCTLVLFSLLALTSLTLFSKNRIPQSYLLIGWIWFLIPLFSATPWLPLYSMSRFVLVVFPIYIFIAQLPVVIYRFIIATSAAGLIIYTALFTSWHWVS